MASPSCYFRLLAVSELSHMYKCIPGFANCPVNYGVSRIYRFFVNLGFCLKYISFGFLVLKVAFLIHT